MGLNPLYIPLVGRCNEMTHRSISISMNIADPIDNLNGAVPHTLRMVANTFVWLCRYIYL